MPAGSPITVWTYISAWLWRQLLLTAGILVTVLAFAAAVKFLAEGRLSPVDTLRFMLYSMPPMLEYALPFSGGLAATLTYHRFAADNEALACQAGGISYRSLLVPGLICGLVLALTLIGLTNRIIPTYLRRMQNMVTRDATRVLINSIRRGEAYSFGDGMLVYADRVEPKGPNEQAGAYQVLYLQGVLLAQLDKETKQVKAEGSARDAFAWFFRDTGPADDPGANPNSGSNSGRRGVTRITLVPRDSLGWVRDQFRVESDPPVITATVPSPIRDDPKFFGWRELRELRVYPERIGQIDIRRRQLATILAERAVIEDMDIALRSDGRLRLIDGLGRAVVLRAGGLEWDAQEKWWRILPPAAPGRADGRIAIDTILDDGRERSYKAARAWLRSLPRPESPGDALTFEIRLSEFSAQGASPEPGIGVQISEAGQFGDRTMKGIKPALDPLPRLMAMSSRALLDIAAAHLDAVPHDEVVRQPAEILREDIDELMREIVSKEQERIAMSVACLVMVLTGGVMAMRLRDSLPLVVYLWSFFPALAAVLTIVGGQQMVHEHGMVGLPLLWGGVGGLAIFTGLEYWKLRKH